MLNCVIPQTFKDVDNMKAYGIPMTKKGYRLKDLLTFNVIMGALAYNKECLRIIYETDIKAVGKNDIVTSQVTIIDDIIK